VRKQRSFPNLFKEKFNEKKKDQIVQDFIKLMSFETLTIHNPCMIDCRTSNISVFIFGPLRSIFLANLPYIFKFIY